MQAHVYVIGSEESPLAKIGVTDDTSRRLREIQSMSPVPLRVLWKTPGGRQLEKALHGYFRAFRQHGEWFRLDNPVQSVQEALLVPNLMTFADPIPVQRTGWKQPERISGESVRVYQGLLARIESGEFPAGELLPRTGVLAAEYGVHTITVVHALKHLWIQGRLVWPRHGRASVAPILQRAEPGPSKAG